jgi:C4-dicarboxylate-specific signal transduction histidine kinase
MLSDVTNSNSQRQVHLEKMIDESMKGIVEVFKSSVGRIDYLYHQLPKSILISKTMFYQLLYILVYLRAKAMESQNEHSWIRIEFSQADNQILITCYDNGAKLEGEERGALLDPFKSIALRDRGSLLMLGTFASLVNKLGAKLNFVDSNKSIFVQVRIPYGEDL